MLESFIEPARRSIMGQVRLHLSLSQDMTISLAFDIVQMLFLNGAYYIACFRISQMIKIFICAVNQVVHSTEFRFLGYPLLRDQYLYLSRKLPQSTKVARKSLVVAVELLSICKKLKD